MHSAINMFVSALPVPVIFLIYRKYFSASNFPYYTEFFLWGMVYACSSLLLNSFLPDIVPDGPVVTAFLKAALIEKGGAFVIIIVLLTMRYSSFNIKEAVLFSMSFGMGFAFFENLHFSRVLDLEAIVGRLASSVPVHVITCGVMGYLIHTGNYFRSTSIKVLYNVAGFAVPYLLHALYDVMIFTGGKVTYLIGVELVIIIFTLEYLIAKGSGRPGMAALSRRSISLEDWISINKIPQYERWIRRSMGVKDTEIVPFFKWHFSAKDFLFLSLFIAVPAAFIWYHVHTNAFPFDGLSDDEQIAIFLIYPAVYSFDILLQETINPLYFKNSILRIPILSNVFIKGVSSEEDLSAGDISTSNSFFKTIQPLGVGREIEFEFEFSGVKSPPIKAKVVWENHMNLLEPFGSVVRWENVPKGFFVFFLQFNIFKFTRGLVFNIKLPGFEAIRQLFVRTATVMEEQLFFAEGDIIFNEGEKGNRFYLLKQGSVEIYETIPSGEKIVFETVLPGQIFGEMAIVGNQTRAATARCVTDCLVAAASSDDLEALISSNKDFSLRLIRTLARRLHRSEQIMKGKIGELENELRRK